MKMTVIIVMSTKPNQVIPESAVGKTIYSRKLFCSSYEEPWIEKPGG